MREMRLAILFSGNGSNLENIYRKMQNLVIDSALTQNLVQNNRAQSAHLESRPLSGAKNREQGRSSASADFLLEAESRGSPPKSEKRELLARRGSRAGGAALLREKTREVNSQKSDDFAESKRDFSPTAQNDKFRVRIAESSVDSADSAKIKLNFAIAISSKESAFGITRCKNLGLKCEVVDYKQNKADFFPKIMQILQNAQIDLVILAGFMKILPPEFNAKFRAINIHPSILPLFKGANAIRESFESDMKIAGVSVHFVSDELDGGALIAQDVIYKIDGESLESFESRIHELEYEIYPKAIIKAIQITDNSGNSQNLWENQTKIAESSLDSADSQNLVKKELCEAPENSPASWCKKSGEASSSASADFLLEAEKRGSPPKSEKRQLLGTQFKKFGGSEERGAALLREEKNNKENAESNAESNRDSSVASLPQNDNLMKIAESALDSAPSTHEANSSIFDEKSGLRSHERGNRTNGSLTKRVASLPDLSQKDAEFDR